MIHTKNLTFWYPSLDTPTLFNINIDIQKNETIAIIGPNGSGKSTLGYCLCGIIPQLINGKFDGEVLVDGKNTNESDISEIVDNVGVLFQDPDVQFVTLRVKDELAFGLENIELPQNEIEIRVAQVAEKFDLLDLFNSAPQNISMGQKQMVALASVIAMKPKILILDEPGSTLDPRRKKIFLNILAQLKGEYTLVLLTHSFNCIKRIADRVVVIHDGIIKFDGAPDLLGKKEVLDLFGVNEKIVKTTAFRQTGSIICVEHLSFKYPQSAKPTISDISFDVNKGEVLGIVGPNGSGKSTLLLLMHGLLKAKQGKVLIDGQNVSKMGFHKLARKQGILFQNPNHQIFSSTVKEELSFGLKNLKVPPEEFHERIAIATDFLKLDDLSIDPHSLSYGQRKLLSLAAILAMDSEIILLDEPELGMDIGFMRKFENQLLALNQSGKTFVIVSHDLDLIESLTDRIIFLEQGRLIHEGPTEQIIEKVRGYFDE